MIKDAEQLELSYIFWCDVKWYNHLGKSLVLQEIAIIFPKKIYHFIFYDLAIAVLRI